MDARRLRARLPSWGQCEAAWQGWPVSECDDIVKFREVSHRLPCQIAWEWRGHSMARPGKRLRRLSRRRMRGPGGFAA